MIVDLFAGPGGWDEGLRAHLGFHDTLGVELDPWAVATRRAAGHATVVGDVAALDPLEVGGSDVEGLIASPPCQLYSNAGSKRGRHAIHLLTTALAATLTGRDERDRVVDAITDVLMDDQPDEELTLALPGVDSPARAAARQEARSAALVLEPARPRCVRGGA